MTTDWASLATAWNRMEHRAFLDLLEAHNRECDRLGLPYRVEVEDE